VEPAPGKGPEAALTGVEAAVCGPVGTIASAARRPGRGPAPRRPRHSEPEKL